MQPFEYIHVRKKPDLDVYNHKPNRADDSLRDAAREIAKQYDSELLAKFRKFKGYGQFGRNSIGCVFSTKPFPAKPKEVKRNFTTHIEGDEVYVLCRLDRPANQFGKGSVEPTFFVELLRGTRLAFSERVGSPTQIGKSRYVRASFTLPHSKYGKDTRHSFAARVKLRKKVPVQLRKRVLCKKEASLHGQASFTWHRI